jgi:hypothetical protein
VSFLTGAAHGGQASQQAAPAPVGSPSGAALPAQRSGEDTSAPQRVIGAAPSQAADGEGTAPKPAGDIARAQQVAEETPAPEPTGGAAPAQPSEEPKSKPKFKLDINGFAMLDSIYDFNRVDPDWEATLRPSFIPIPANRPNGQSVWSVRQSRLNFVGNSSSSVGDFTTRFEFDLFGVGADAGKTTIRVRHVYGQIGHWLFGQTNSVFMDADLYPNVVDYWGPAGMVFLRNPQVRYTVLNKNGHSIQVSLEAPFSGVDSGKVNGIDPTLGVAGHDRYPDLAMHYRHDCAWGHWQLAGIVRSVGFESRTSPTGNPSGNEAAGGGSLGGVLKVFKNDKIYAQFTYGAGISNYMNDGGSDLAPDSNLHAATIATTAGEFYYEHPWNSKWISTIGYSQHHQDNQGGQLDTAFHSGQYTSANLLYSPDPNILMGVEYLWGERKNKDGQAGIDNRIQFSFKYNFSN